MDPELEHFLRSQRPFATTEFSWGETGRLQVAYYLCSEQPPSRLVTSVRSVVFQADSVLVVRDAEDNYHIFPGGSPEQGEALEATLRREMLEETGWTISDISLLGFAHFHHLDPRPVNYTYPYPDFVWLIYVSRADKYYPEAMIPGIYELETGFRLIVEVSRLPLDQVQTMLLDAAIKIRPSSG